MPEYAVDTNVFLEAKNRYYQFDMPPGRWFWGLIDRSVGAGIVHSAWKMRQELLPADDQLTAWAKGHGHDLWIPPDADILQQVKELVTWAQDRVGPSQTDLLQRAVDEFARGDIFLIATAKARGLTVVTHEVSAPQARGDIKIPDACAAAGVPVIDPWTMLEDLDNRLGE